MRNKCYQGGERHNFEPRYDEQSVEYVGDLSFKWTTAKEIRSFFFYKIYLYDIYMWCGKKVER